MFCRQGLIYKDIQVLEGADKPLIDLRILSSMLSGTISMLTLQETYDNDPQGKGGWV